MPLYMSTFDYTPEVWAELVHSPENRTEAISRILENAGCKLKGLWYAFGSSDAFALIEAPDNVTSASIAIAINASGAFRKFETTVLMTQDELLEGSEQGTGRRLRGARHGRSRLTADRRREPGRAQSGPAHEQCLSTKSSCSARAGANASATANMGRRRSEMYSRSTATPGS